MPTIAVADIPVEEFALRESLQAVPALLDHPLALYREVGDGLERFAERELFYGNVGNGDCRHYSDL